MWALSSLDVLYLQLVMNPVHLECNVRTSINTGYVVNENVLLSY